MTRAKCARGKATNDESESIERSMMTMKKFSCDDDPIGTTNF